jgi:hypothetical protein
LSHDYPWRASLARTNFQFSGEFFLSHDYPWRASLARTNFQFFVLEKILLSHDYLWREQIFSFLVVRIPGWRDISGII